MTNATTLVADGQAISCLSRSVFEGISKSLLFPLSPFFLSTACATVCFRLFATNSSACVNFVGGGNGFDRIQGAKELMHTLGLSAISCDSCGAMISFLSCLAAGVSEVVAGIVVTCFARPRDLESCKSFGWSAIRIERSCAVVRSSWQVTSFILLLLRWS
ncbi:hypothetical protein IWZ00DRAFT_113178 [Phyllosticta capitalensis]|uniref:Uncharacterized protein n=1 Tax=Phyllosticta capitalensis TaxID=121624 RepID=A0ABR1YCZ2_9PEZI